MSNLTSTSSIEALGRASAELPQVDLKTDHHFAGGIYARRVYRPAGTIIVGKKHRSEHFYVVASGCVEVAGKDGNRRYFAGDIVVTKPGEQRAVYALVDSICITFHRTDETDPEKIEKELVEECGFSRFDHNNLLESKS